MSRLNCRRSVLRPSIAKSTAFKTSVSREGPLEYGSSEEYDGGLEVLTGETSLLSGKVPHERQGPTQNGYITIISSFQLLKYLNAHQRFFKRSLGR